MFIVVLALFAVLGYLPPFYLASHLDTYIHAPGITVLRWTVHPFDGSFECVSLVCIYLLAAIMASTAASVLFPGRKPVGFRLLAVPDELGGLNLLVLVGGGVLAAIALLALASPDIAALGIATAIGLLAHFREMAQWQYAESEAARRRWARGL
jgi:hypothetical protein